jgi:serine/threonine protein kinase
VFDFGLSKEVHKGLAVGDGTFKLTGCTGSTRYMAPEIAREEPYNMTCDVYSFAVLFWQMLALEKPFSNYGISDIKSRVYNGESRPKVDDSWAVPIKLLLEKSWASDWKERYQFKDITPVLRKEIVRIRSGDDSGLEHQRRRSTFVFRGDDRVSGNGMSRAALLAKANSDWGVAKSDDESDDDGAVEAPKKAVPTTKPKAAAPKKKVPVKRSSPQVVSDNDEFCC